jgi:hypothetical protein
MPGGGSFKLVTVPAGIAYFDNFGCFAQHRDVTPACVPPFVGDRNELVDARTSAANYNPVYYAIIGVPSLITSGVSSVYGMRLINAFLSCLLLASAFSALARLQRHKWAALALTGAVTPMVLFLNGAVNPNALEYAAAAALLANLVLLLENAHLPKIYPSCILVITAAACLLANAKALSLLWLALMVITAGLLGTWSQIQRVIRSPWTWGGGAAIGLSCAFALFWIVGHDSLSSDSFEAAGFSALAGAEIMLDRTFDYATGYVGQFGWLEIPAPMAAHILWLGIATALVMSAVVLTRGRTRYAVLFLLVALLLLPPLLQAQAMGTIGIVWQGRYMLAVFVPLLIVAGIGLDRKDSRGFSPGTAQILKSIAVLLAVVHFWTFMLTLRRYVTGLSIDRRWADMVLEPVWQPPGGVFVCVALYLIVLMLALVLTRRAISSQGAHCGQNS